MPAAQGPGTLPCHGPSTSGRKRAADTQLLHPAASKQRRGPLHAPSPAAALIQLQAYPTQPQAHDTRWGAALSPIQMMSTPADCCSASCRSAASAGPLPTGTTAHLQPASLLQYPRLAVLHVPHTAAPQATCLDPTHTSAGPLHQHQAPHHTWAPSTAAAPQHLQHAVAEASSLSQHSHSLRLTPSQASGRTSITSWPTAAAAATQPPFWGPSPPPQAPLWHPSPACTLWEPSPSSSTCSASSWISAAAPCPPQYHHPHPQQPHQHPLPQYPQPSQQLHHPTQHHQHQLQHHPTQHHSTHQHAQPQDTATTILCQLSVAAVAHPQHAPCQPQSLLPPPQAAPQPPRLPPSVAWYSDTNSPAALLEANDFLTTVSLPGNVEYLRVSAGSAMHRLGVLCSVSAASICLGQSYYLRLRHCMPLLQGALRALSSLPRGSAKCRTAAAAASRSHAESVITGVKFTCVTLAAKMLEARSGQQKQLRGLLAQLTASTMAPTDTLAIEVRVLQHLDWRLGPYFLPPASECDDAGWQ